MNEKKKNNALRNGIILIIVFLLGMGGMYAIVYFFPATIGEVITREERKVTINDTGIAEAVDKIYDAVVVVNTYINDKQYASGSGFVYKVDGNTAYILTNNHVITKADDVYVKFTDGEVVKTEIVGSDVYSDIAVLSLDKKYIKAIAEIGSSKDTRLGDTVFATGAPLDSAYSWSVTRGTLSGKDRLIEVELTNGNSYTRETMVVNTIQTDAAINNGNSGGPLANANGEVIGITSIKLASETIEGMGFAIPIETAIEYAEELIKGQSISRPYLGVSMIDVMKAGYRYSNLIYSAGVTSGVIIADVDSKSAADLAGLEINDIVIKVDNKEVPTSAYLRYYLYGHKAGDEMKLTIIRNGKEKEIKVKLTAN